MREIQLSSGELLESLLNLPSELNLCLLDSCGVSHLNSHLLVAGIEPIEQIEITDNDPQTTLGLLTERISNAELSAIFTISYDFGLRLNQINSRHPKTEEPDVFLALFETLIIHDYDTDTTFLTGIESRFDEIERLLLSAGSRNHSEPPSTSEIRSNFSRQDYLRAIEEIHELIRGGQTYQTNLTQQIRAALPSNLTPEIIFQRLRKSHPAPFASFIRRKNDVVISASPERFFRVRSSEFGTEGDFTTNSRMISVSPIKGTRRRGENFEEDSFLRNELLNSEKELAENVMIVDLLRNDLGRICEFGSIAVETLCDLEEHPTLFHLVSTVSGKLRKEVEFSDILRATFPCGSITGAPKLRTMRIIDEIETAPRELSMGAIGFTTGQNVKGIRQNLFDLSVAIRTMVVREGEAVFNVGGGIVIDSDPNSEYEETLTKAKALLNALGADENKLKV